MLIRFQSNLYHVQELTPDLHLNATLTLTAGSYSLWPASNSQLHDPHQLLIIDCRLLTLGGKGGFGSLLKRKGMKVKIHNFQSSRDLSGRRLRDVEAPERARALTKQKEWEEKVVAALGGEDPFLNQKMSSIHCIQTYSLRLAPNSADPTLIKSRNTLETPTHFADAAALQVTRQQLQSRSTSPREQPPKDLSESCLRELSLAIGDV